MTELEKGVYFQLENLIQNNSSNISGMKETCEDLQCKLLISSYEALITIPYSVFNLLKKKMNNESKCYNFIKEVEQMKYFTTRQFPDHIKNNLGPIID